MNTEKKHRIKVTIPRLGGQIELESDDRDFVVKQFDRLAGLYFKTENSAETTDEIDEDKEVVNEMAELAPRKGLSLQEFVKQLTPKNGTDYLLAIGYFLEKIVQRTSFSSSDVVQELKKLKVNHSNPYQAIAGARARGLLMDGAEGPRSLQLSNTGMEAVEVLMKEKNIRI